MNVWFYLHLWIYLINCCQLSQAAGLTVNEHTTGNVIQYMYRTKARKILKGLWYKTKLYCNPKLLAEREDLNSMQMYLTALAITVLIPFTSIHSSLVLYSIVIVILKETNKLSARCYCVSLRVFSFSDQDFKLTTLVSETSIVTLYLRMLNLLFTSILGKYDSPNTRDHTLLNYTLP